MLTLSAPLCSPSVRKHLLLQLGAAGAVLLPAVPGERAGVQSAAEEEGEPAHMPGRPLPLHRHAEEEGGRHPAQEVHLTAAERER